MVDKESILQSGCLCVCPYIYIVKSMSLPLNFGKILNASPPTMKICMLNPFYTVPTL